jgi:hypothetical protein
VERAVVLNVIKGIFNFADNVIDASTFSLVALNQFPDEGLAVGINIDIIVGGVMDAGIKMLFSEGIRVGHGCAPDAGSH